MFFTVGACLFHLRVTRRKTYTTRAAHGLTSTALPKQTTFLGDTMEKEQSRRAWLQELARLHREKWQKTGDIILLKIAYDLEIEATFWGPHEN